MFHPIVGVSYVYSVSTLYVYQGSSLFKAPPPRVFRLCGGQSSKLNVSIIDVFRCVPVESTYWHSACCWRVFVRGGFLGCWPASQ